MSLFERAQTTFELTDSDTYRFWSYVDVTEGCWLWTGYRVKAGYGSFNLRQLPVKAHRVAYFLLRGEIPAGLVLDHLCLTHACVNPDHLEPVTPSENSRRGSRRTHCKRGHEWTAENIYVRPDTGNRMCKECMRSRFPQMLERRSAKRALIRMLEGKPLHRDKTHCPRGHPYSVENTYLIKTGGRGCRACGRERMKAKYWARKWDREMERTAQPRGGGAS